MSAGAPRFDTEKWASKYTKEQGRKVELMERWSRKIRTKE
jgi:hypothetical protein